MRQGDVLLVPVSTMPPLAHLQSRDETGQIVLEYGEATGHAHVVLERNAEMYVIEQAGQIVAQYLHVVDGPVTLRHEEHGPHTLIPGIYERWYQMEYDGEEERRVAD